MPPWLLLFWGFGVILLEGPLLQLLGAQAWALQLGLLMVMYASLRLSFEAAAWMLLLWMIPIEWMCAGPSGFYAFGMVLVFLLLRLFEPSLDKRWSLAHSILSGVGVLAHQLLLVGYLLITKPSDPMLMAILSTSISAALIGGLVSFPLGHLTERVGRLFSSRQRSEGLWLDSK